MDCRGMNEVTPTLHAAVPHMLERQKANFAIKQSRVKELDQEIQFLEEKWQDGQWMW